MKKLKTFLLFYDFKGLRNIGPKLGFYRFLLLVIYICQEMMHFFVKFTNFKAIFHKTNILSQKQHVDFALKFLGFVHRLKMCT